MSRSRDSLSSIFFDWDQVNPDWLSRFQTSADTSAYLLFLSPETHIHNAEQIAPMLGLSQDTGNAQLLLEAWSQWGRDCPRKLRGTFAFGIFDPQARTLFVVRDVFGLAPVYYQADGHAIGLAAQSRLLRAVMPVERERNLNFYADFAYGIFSDNQSTFFGGINRLPPAHIWEVREDESTQTRYWNPADIGIEYGADDPVQAFRDKFDRSVLRSLADGDQNAITLSGGLDSSAIAGTLQAYDALSQAKVITKTYYDTKGWNDQPYLDALAKRFDLDTTTVPSDAHDPLSDMEHWLQVLDGPYVSYGHSVASQLLTLSAKMGRTNILSGHGGDEVVSYGWGRLNELALARRWRTLWRELPGASGLSKGSHWPLLAFYLNHYKPLRPLYRAAMKFAQGRGSDAPQAISRDLHHEVGLDRYNFLRAENRLSHTEQDLHVQALTDPIQPLALETITQCSRAAGVRTAMPFYCQDLVEHTLALPPELKMQGGLTRFILRQAMKDRLPENILQRKDKYDFTGSFIRGLKTHKEKLLDWTQDSTHLLDDFMHRPTIEAIRDQLASGANISTSEGQIIWRAAVLRMWLEEESKPVQPIQPTTHD